MVNISYRTVLLSELYKSGIFGQANTPVDQKWYLQTKINRKAFFILFIFNKPVNLKTQY